MPESERVSRGESELLDTRKYEELLSVRVMHEIYERVDRYNEKLRERFNKDWGALHAEKFSGEGDYRSEREREYDEYVFTACKEKLRQLLEEAYQRKLDVRSERREKQKQKFMQKSGKDFLVMKVLIDKLNSPWFGRSVGEKPEKKG